ncbi:hypothetical protein JM93_01685 [Roseibium hamelinense]|uniref:Uncharacterized protein n=1 Tax=Roseibium hamelinense TaxID=150831 RepID=A0A562T7K8_9HYPH|nr:hypothetical protein JM93_01685 [Roseibium hamelinense]
MAACREDSENTRLGVQGRPEQASVPEMITKQVEAYWFSSWRESMGNVDRFPILGGRRKTQLIKPDGQRAASTPCRALDRAKCPLRTPFPSVFCGARWYRFRWGGRSSGPYRDSGGHLERAGFTDASKVSAIFASKRSPPYLSSQTSSPSSCLLMAWVILSKVSSTVSEPPTFTPNLSKNCFGIRLRHSAACGLSFFKVLAG